MQVKAVQFRASFTWLSSSVHHGHVAVIVMQKSLKAVEKWSTMAMKVSVPRLRELNVQRKKVAEMSGTQKEGISISVAQAQVQQEVVGDLV